MKCSGFCSKRGSFCTLGVISKSWGARRLHRVHVRCFHYSFSHKCWIPTWMSCDVVALINECCVYDLGDWGYVPRWNVLYLACVSHSFFLAQSYSTSHTVRRRKNWSGIEPVLKLLTRLTFGCTLMRNTKLNRPAESVPPENVGDCTHLCSSGNCKSCRQLPKRTNTQRMFLRN